MDFDSLKIVASLVLGAIGACLGVYNFVVARHERKQRAKHGFATMLLSLDPVVDKLLAVPLQDPTKLNSIDSAQLSHALTEVDEAIKDERKELINLIPEIAGRILDLKNSSAKLQRKVSDPATQPMDWRPEATAFLRASWPLRTFGPSRKTLRCP